MEGIIKQTALAQKNRKQRKSKAVLAAVVCLSPVLSYANDLTEVQQRQVIEHTLDILQHSIYSKEQVAQLSRVLKKNLVEFNYAGYEDKRFFSQKLSKDIASKLGTDKVLLKASTASPAPETQVNKLNVLHALGEVAIIDVDFNASKSAIDQAFNAIEQSDALILDLRNEDDGQLDKMRYLAGYFFNSEISLAELINGSKTIESTITSDASIAGTVRPQLPTYILTNSSTSGLAEIFAMALQQQRSAYVVGENTAGEVNVKESKTVFSDMQLTYPVATVVETKSQMAIEGIGIEPDLPVVSILSLKQAHELAKVAAIKYRVTQGTATPEEQYSLYRNSIEYGQWQYAKGKCLVSYRVAEPRFNQATNKYQFPFQVKFYGTGKSKVSYELGNDSGKMTHTVHFIDRDDVKSGISIGFSSHLPLTIKRCRRLKS